MSIALMDISLLHLSIRPLRGQWVPKCRSRELQIQFPQDSKYIHADMQGASVCVWLLQSGGYTSSTNACFPLVVTEPCFFIKSPDRGFFSEVLNVPFNRVSRRGTLSCVDGNTDTHKLTHVCIGTHSHTHTHTRTHVHTHVHTHTHTHVHTQAAHTSLQSMLLAQGQHSVVS